MTKTLKEKVIFTFIAIIDKCSACEEDNCNGCVIAARANGLRRVYKLYPGKIAFHANKRLLMRKKMFEKGYKPLDLAELLGVDKSTIMYWVSGRYTPDQAKWPRICELLDLPRDYFVGFNYDKEE